MEEKQTEQQHQIPPEIVAHENRKWIIVAFVFLIVSIVILALSLIFFSFNDNHLFSNGSKTTNNMLFSPQITPTPTPIEFAEMTIPYLRTRDYKSSLGEKTVSYSTASYTAYTTSYTSDGLRVNGLLTEPTGEKPLDGWPAIVFIHGYIPPTTYKTTQNYYDYVDYLARNGFVVFKIDLRGHGDSEGEAGGGYYSSDYIIDALSAIAALQATDFVKGDAIGLWGHSMAGNIVMRSFAARPNIAAVVIWAGAVYTYTDMQKYGINDNSYRPPQNVTERQRKRQRLRDIHGDPSETSEFWKQVVPTNYLTDLKGAIQIHHAVDDDVVNVGYSRDLNELLNKTSVVHELSEYESGGHNITGSSFTQAMERTVEFYKEYLD